MPEDVDYLATFNVLYRHRVLERLDGFDERLVTAEDADFCFRVEAAGYGLRFDRESRVRHFHPTDWWAYLRTQRRHGYWRVWLYLRHSDRTGGDDYSGLIDHVQPPLAVASLAMGPLVFVPALRWASPAAMLLLLLAQATMTLRIWLRTRRRRYLWFAPMSFLRAYSRGVGMVFGVLAVGVSLLRGRGKADGERGRAGEGEKGRPGA
jgi:cellulose synthase/poly-beta-1,6-N-acetylglucosamine synthase-like glycosyltransferase